MKIDEFIEKVNKIVYAKYEDGVIGIYEDLERTPVKDWFLCIDPSEQSLNDAVYWESADSMGTVDLFYILGLVQELRKTPVKDRFPKKHYRVRLRGFNSDGGHQYLTVSTRYSTINLGSVFATAWNTGLKQTFTADELNKIRERFKDIKWIVSMLNDGVKEDDE